MKFNYICKQKFVESYVKQKVHEYYKKHCHGSIKKFLNKFYDIAEETKLWCFLCLSPPES